MRVLGHHCARVMQNGANVPTTVVCACGASWTSVHGADAVDAFTAHVIGNIALAAFDGGMQREDQEPTTGGDHGD